MTSPFLYPPHSSASSRSSEEHSMQELHHSIHQEHDQLLGPDGQPASSSTPSKPTAQALFDVSSHPSTRQQLRALVVKNSRISRRDLSQTLNAIFQPVWMMLVLVFLHLSAKDASKHMDVKALPFLSVDTCTTLDACTYFGYTGLPATDPIISELSGFFAASEPQTVVPKFYTNEQAMLQAYDASPINFVVGVVFLGPSTNLTRPRSPTAGPLGDEFQYSIVANHSSFIKKDYVGTRFATAQAYVERAAINLRRKANNKPALSSPLPLKTDPGTANTGAGRTFISFSSFVGQGTSINASLNAYYVIFCFQAVWQVVLSLLVTEKANKIRMGMTMMGMSQNAYICSVWLMQNAMNVGICALMILILFVGKIFENSNALIVFLLLLLFSFNATAIGTIASVLVPDPKKVNGASFILLIITVGSYGACAALVFGGGKIVDPTTETLIMLIPSVALGHAINYITGIEKALGGVTFENINEGPCAKALWMMAIDVIIFSFLGWYLDAVFPGQYGHALPFDFLFRPSYWGVGQYQRALHPEAVEKIRPASLGQSQARYAGGAKADMFEDYDVSRLPVEDRSIIQVQGLRKTFSTPIGFAYSIPLLGLFARLVYPPKASRTEGPFKGAQVNEVVGGLDLEVHRNEIFGFLGHNGAGKTTSLSIIMGMVSPSSGTVVVNGHLLPGSEGVSKRSLDLRTLSEVQKTMGVCPQHDILFQTLTAWETVHLYAAIKGVQVRGRKAFSGQESSTSTLTTSSQKDLLDDYLNQLLDDVYLKEKKNERVSTFSGGMKRKLSVALAFLGDPKVVLLDEPTTGMDVFTRKQVWQLMQDSKAGRAILLTTHSMEEADALGDRIAILSHGKLQTLGSSLFLKNRFGLGYRLNLEKRRVMLADQNQLHHLQNRNQYQNPQPHQEEVLFDEARTTAIVQQYFSDATVEVNNTTEITYVLPTTASTEVRQGRTAQEYIQDKKAALPMLFAKLDEEMAANRLGVKSVGLSLTTLEEVFVSLQEQEELAQAEKEAAKAK